jgi:hypothetical protein
VDSTSPGRQRAPRGRKKASSKDPAGEPTHS